MTFRERLEDLLLESWHVELVFYKWVSVLYSVCTGCTCVLYSLYSVYMSVYSLYGMCMCIYSVHMCMCVYGVCYIQLM